MSTTVKKALHELERLKQCQKTLCKKERDANLKLVKAVNAKTAKLQTALLNDKIGRDEFQKQMNAIHAKMLDSSKTQKMIACSVEKCNKEYYANIKGLIALIKKENPEMHKVGVQLLKKKDASVDDYIAFLRRMLGGFACHRHLAPTGRRLRRRSSS